jgi:AcrR family transcriptional regulator
VARQYDSSRRKRAAEQTRQAILTAALKLHWEGITEFAALAEEAGCSLATVRKHYATKEAVFRDCTRAFSEQVVMPDVAAIAVLPDRRARIEAAIGELARMHALMFGYAWHSAYLRDESPSLDAIMQQYDDLVDALSEVIAPAGSTKSQTIRGLTDFLSYRALRVSGGLSPEEVADELRETACLLLGI